MILGWLLVRVTEGERVWGWGGGREVVVEYESCEGIFVCCDFNARAQITGLNGAKN